MAKKAEIKRYPLNMRTTKSIRDRLESAANDSGRSLAQEVEYRLERSFETQELLPEILTLSYGKRLAELLLKIASDIKPHAFVEITQKHIREKVEQDEINPAERGLVALLESEWPGFEQRAIKLALYDLKNYFGPNFYNIAREALIKRKASEDER